MYKAEIDMSIDTNSFFFPDNKEINSNTTESSPQVDSFTKYLNLTSEYKGDFQEGLRNIQAKLVKAPLSDDIVRNIKLANRICELERDYRAPGSAFQRLYFASNIRFGGEFESVRKMLDNSRPDRALYAFIKDLESYKEQLTSKDEIGKVNDIINEFTHSFEIALLLSLYFDEPSMSLKEEIRMDIIGSINDKYMNLEVGETLHIPSGYMIGDTYDVFEGLSGNVVGHSTILSLTKENEEIATARYINSNSHKQYNIQIKGSQINNVADGMTKFLRLDQLEIDPNDETLIKVYRERHSVSSTGESSDDDSDLEDIKLMIATTSIEFLSDDLLCAVLENNKVENAQGKGLEVEIEKQTVNNCTYMCLKHSMISSHEDIQEDFFNFQIQKRQRDANLVLDTMEEQDNEYINYRHPFLRISKKKDALFYFKWISLAAVLLIKGYKAQHSKDLIVSLETKNLRNFSQYIKNYQNPN